MLKYAERVIRLIISTEAVRYPSSHNMFYSSDLDNIPSKIFYAISIKEYK